MSAPGFWEKQEEARKLVAELKDLKGVIEAYGQMARDVADGIELAAMIEADGAGDTGMIGDLGVQVEAIERAFLKFRVRVAFTAPEDRMNAFVSIHSGAGGTESCDWAAMLLRMYTRWFDARGWKYRMIDESPNEEAGLKSVTLEVEGDHVYGYMRGEMGIHRLVRISPFDAKGRRHTSFSAVDVVPEYEEAAAIVINENDLRIDTYRSGGAGGQHVNKTDSAVRITHLPTGLVVQCQNERSQFKNKSFAMKVLQSRLEHLERAKEDKRIKDLYGEKGEIAWGNQIRSYVLAPYTMVNDHRTEVKIGNAQRVMDGDLDQFVDAYLEQNVKI